MKGVKDLLDSSNYNFLSHTAFITKYNIKTNYLEYYKVVSALEHFRKKCSLNQNPTPLEKPLKTCSLPSKFEKRFIRFILATLETAKLKKIKKYLEFSPNACKLHSCL